MRVPHISDSQMELLATRLGAIGVGRRDFLRVAAGLATMGAAGVNARPASAAPKLAPGEKLAKEQHLRYGGGSWYEQDPSSHDYNKDLYCGGTQQLFAGLMKFNVDFEAVPYVAEKVTPNKDGSVWTFTLRKDSKWSDGSPCSARDFEYSFKRQLDPATAAPYASFLYDIKNGEAFNKKQITDAKEVGVRAKDDWTLEVTLEGPRGYFPVLSAYSAALPGHKGSIEKYGDKWTEAANIVGNGPFVLDVWEHNKVIILKKNKHFFGAKDITLEKVTIPIIPIASGVLPYENNEIDLTRLQTADLKRFQSDPKTAKEVFRFPYPGTWYLLPQVTKPPFDNLKVRQAVAYAIPYQKIMDAVLFGLSKPMFGAPAGKTTEVAWPQPHAFNTDIEKAKALMAEAGYANGFETTLSFDLGFAGVNEPLCVLTQESLAQIGIKCTINKVPGATWRTELNKKVLPLYTNVFSGWLDYPEYFFIWCYHGKNSIFNTMGYQSKTLDGFVDGAVTAAANGDKAAYEKDVKGFVETAFADMPRIPIFQPYVNVAMQKNVTGYQYWFHRRLDYRSFEKG